MGGGTLKADDAVCPAGSYITTENVCELCPVGTYSSSENATTCTKCNTISYNDTPGATACTKCDKGYYPSDDRTECLLCEPGYYCAMTNIMAGKRTACPETHPYSDAGAKSKNECYTTDVECAVPDNCLSAVCRDCSTAENKCEILTYYDGTVVESDCASDACNPAEVVSVVPQFGYYDAGVICAACSDDDTYPSCAQCSPGTYLSGTGCVSCPADYPNSDWGATAITDCFSDWKPRDCTIPNGCADISYQDSEMCYYQAYAKRVRQSGKWVYQDGSIKEGCAENDCTALPLLSINALPGYYVDGDKCTACPVGLGSPGGDITECAPCADGEYLSGGVCTACPDGYPHSEPDATAATECFSDTRYRPYDGTVQCRTMPDGCTFASCTVCESEPEPCEYAVYAKKSGTKYIDGDIKPGGCTANPCISDVINVAYDLDNGLHYNSESNKCEQCGPGTYFSEKLDFLTWNFISECTPCPAGKYNPTGGGMDSNACLACPAGTFSADGASECTPCNAANEYQPNTGATTCTAVPDGYIKTDNTAIEKCGFNSWCTDGVSHSCTELDAIFARVETEENSYKSYYSGYKSPDECKVTLPAGSEFILTNNGVVENKCAPGSYNSFESSCSWARLNATPNYDNDRDYTLNVGYYCRCNLCRPGSMSSKTGTQTECFPCPNGTYNVGYGNSSCLPCPAGTIADAPTYKGATECTPCPSGTYAPTPASPYCLMCPPNTYSDIGASECKPCAADASSDEYCGRMLNIQPPNGGKMTQIFLSPTRFTSPSMNFQVNNRVFYADMTPVDNSGEPGMYARYNDQTYRVSDGTVLNKISTPKFWVLTRDNTSTFTFTIAARGTFVVDWGDDTREQRTHDDVEPQTYTHTYSTPGQYKVGLGGLATEYAIFDPYNPDYSRATLSFGGLHTACHWGGCSSDKYNDDYNPVYKFDGVLSGVFPTIGNGGNGNQPNFAATFSGECSPSSTSLNPFEGLHGIPSDGMFMYTFAYHSYGSGVNMYTRDWFRGLSYTAPYLFAYMFYNNAEFIQLQYDNGLFSTISGPIRPYMFAYTFGCDGWNHVSGPVPENFFGNLTGDDAAGAFEGMLYKSQVTNGLENLTLPDGRYIWDVWPNSGTSALYIQFSLKDEGLDIPDSWRKP